MSNFNVKSVNQTVKSSDGNNHQTSPGWMLTVVSFINPELRNPIPSEYGTTPSVRATASRPPKWNSQIGGSTLTNDKPLIITSDCINLTVSHSKSSPHGSLRTVLMPGNINYMAAISAGDYVLANMLDYQQQITDDTQTEDSLVTRAEKLKPINLISDGFKGVFKVTSVRQELSVDASGRKFLAYVLEGKSFQEFENSIYFSPYITRPFGEEQDLKYLANIGATMQSKTGLAGPIQSIVQNFISLILGGGPTLKDGPPSSTPVNGAPLKKADTSGVLVSPNQAFLVPKGLGELLGIPNAVTFSNFYRFFLGIQKYGSYRSPSPKKRKGSNIPLVQNRSPSSSPSSPSADEDFDVDAYNPEFKPNKANFFLCPSSVQGTTTVRPEYFNQSSGWSIINGYSNSPINEMFTTFRLSPEGHIMPILVFRQIPFSSNHYASLGNNCTPFLSLPRWIVSPSLVKSLSVGRDDALRVNFVQVFGIPFGYNGNAETPIAQQSAAGQNSVIDSSDIRRSGLRPYVIQNSLDYNAGFGFRSATWARLLADALMGGQMKLSGQLTCFGIQDPIALGDNLEFDGIVYHIEGLSHSCSLENNGQKTFTTTVNLSHGIDSDSNNEYTVYGNTINDLYKDELETDYSSSGGKILPGVTNDRSSNKGDS